MKKKPTVSEPTQYLNVDLDIHSSKKLAPLVEALGESVAVLYVGKATRGYSAHLELAGAGFEDDPNETIIELVRLIKRLRSEARTLWKTARKRQFNIGIACGRTPYAFELTVNEDSVDAIRSVDAEIVMTVYAPDRPVVQLS